MIKASIGDEIRRYRKKKGFTLDGLSHQAGVGMSFLKELEAGEKQATVTTLFKLSRALDITPDKLIMPTYQRWLNDLQHRQK